jgi:catechol 2,3-dioxygenase-like lactoylglutathione lyase family enzyme
MATTATTKYDVGGILLDRPFKIRRLGHFGFNVEDLEAARHFYVDLLGFRTSDVMNDADGQPRGIFTRYGGDHHAFVLFKKQPARRPGPGASPNPEVTVNQITWQVSSLSEVSNAAKWFADNEIQILRAGRDMPGSNWHAYVPDPYGHTNEIYYGIEQVGWDGLSKPRDMYYRGFREAPPLPQMNEFAEVQDAIAKGIDIHSGHRQTEEPPARYEVDGILLPRPFQINKIGPVSLFVDNVDTAAEFYSGMMGFVETERSRVNGHVCVFLRTGTEHHSLSLYPRALRSELGFSPHTSCMAFGVQLSNYRQLCDAVDFLRENGVQVRTDLPAELHPGVDYAGYAFDPEGHAIQLYYYMEQVGWDGQPRPASLRRKVDPADWPETLEGMTDSYTGEVLLGPWT